MLAMSLLSSELSPGCGVNCTTTMGFNRRSECSPVLYAIGTQLFASVGKIERIYVHYSKPGDPELLPMPKGYLMNVFR